MKKVFIIALSSAGLFLYSCGNQAKNPSATERGTTTLSQQEAVATQQADTSQADVVLKLSSNDQMQFDKKELKVKAGQKIALILTHTGTISKGMMGHNFVLLKPGTDLAAFASDAASEKGNDYIPESNAIIAHTPLIGGGESTSILFEAPAKGSYDFICSFPGHYSMMNGKFIVE